MTERKLVCSPPSKLPRLSDARVDDGAGEVTMATPSPLVLGLGLGVGGSPSESSGGDKEASASSSRDTRPTPKSAALTFMQRQELECQVLIYRYFAASAPVPVHLVLPIWKSVASSSSSSGVQRFPSLTGLGRLCFDHRSSDYSVQPEPGRCRRTDGKKWRCSRGVVPGLKYCERHVHRGRGRSRKPVEAAATNAIPMRAVHAAAGAQAANARALALQPPLPPQRVGFSSAAGAGVLLVHGTARSTR